MSVSQAGDTTRVENGLMSLNTSEWAAHAATLSEQFPGVYPRIDPLLDWVVPRDETVERVVASLMPMLNCGLHSSEAQQLRRVLLDNPRIETMRELQDYLCGAEQAAEHRSAEMDLLAQFIERWAPPRLFGGPQ